MIRTLLPLAAIGGLLIASSPVAFAQGASTVSPGQSGHLEVRLERPEMHLGHPEVRQANCISIAAKRPQGARRELQVILLAI
jgi:hypothetical protein